MAKPIDPQQLNNADFRWFILHFPAVLLKNAKIQRSSFVAVGMALAQYGNYEYGTNVNPSQKLIHTLTGAHEDTIKKVYDVLKEHEVLEVTGSHQGVNGGQPSEIFRFRKSLTVIQVLNRRAAKEWEEKANPTGESANPTGESANPTGEDNRNVLEEHNGSVAITPSPAPVVALSPDGASDCAVTPDDTIRDSWMDRDSEIDVLLAGI